MHALQKWQIMLKQHALFLVIGTFLKTKIGLDVKSFTSSIIN